MKRYSKRSFAERNPDGPSDFRDQPKNAVFVQKPGKSTTEAMRLGGV
uniref:Uncharacterized protein n=1 Tax=Anguilla anguilla TaxID=7936 RepID=A0A0E9X188_ANGAN